MLFEVVGSILRDEPLPRLWVGLVLQHFVVGVCDERFHRIHQGRIGPGIAPHPLAYTALEKASVLKKLGEVSVHRRLG